MYTYIRQYYNNDIDLFYGHGLGIKIRIKLSRNLHKAEVFATNFALELWEVALLMAPSFTVVIKLLRAVTAF